MWYDSALNETTISFYSQLMLADRFLFYLIVRKRYEDIFHLFSMQNDAFFVCDVLRHIRIFSLTSECEIQKNTSNLHLKVNFDRKELRSNDPQVDNKNSNHPCEGISRLRINDDIECPVLSRAKL